MRIISNSRVGSCELYLVELLCIMKAVSRCCVCYTVRKNDSITPSPCSSILAAHPKPCQGAGALSSDGKMGFFLEVSPSPRLCASHPCTGWKATHHTRCLHVFHNLLAVHKTNTWNRQMPSDPKCPRAYYVNVTYIKKVQRALGVTSCVHSPFPLFTSAVGAVARTQLLHCGCHNLEETKIAPILETFKRTSWGIT